MTNPDRAQLTLWSGNRCRGAQSGSGARRVGAAGAAHGGKAGPGRNPRPRPPRGSAAVTQIPPAPPGARHRRCPRHLPGPRTRGGARFPALPPCAPPRAAPAGAGGGSRCRWRRGGGAARLCSAGGPGPARRVTQPPAATAEFYKSRRALPAARAPCAHPRASPSIAGTAPSPARAHAMSPPGCGTPRTALTPGAGGAPRRGWAWHWERLRDEHLPRRYVRWRGLWALPGWGVWDGGYSHLQPEGSGGSPAKAPSAGPVLGAYRSALTGLSQVRSENWQLQVLWFFP